MLQRILVMLSVVLAVGGVYLLLTDHPRVVPYRNTAHYWLLRWSGGFDRSIEVQRGVLAGAVRTRQGEPIADATVLISQIDGSVASALTNRRGRYTITAPVGRYTPVAGAPGYEDSVVRTLLGVGIAAGQTTQLDIVLSPRPQRVVTPPHQVQIGAPQSYVIEQPIRATAVRRELSYVADGRSNQRTFFYTPNDGQETLLPVLLAVYPGPAEWWENVSLPLAQAGYAVIGVGPAYALDLEPDVDDLERLVTMARDGTLPRADGDRIGALGGSYSGLHVLRLTIHDPDAIDAALLLGPPTDMFELRRLFEEGSFAPPFNFDKALIALGLPDRAPERYWRYSARYHSRDIDVPLMLIHSNVDEVVPFTQSQILADELDRLRKPYELHILEGMGHYFYESEDIPAIEDLFQTTTDFFNEQLVIDRQPSALNANGADASVIHVDR